MRAYLCAVASIACFFLTACGTASSPIDDLNTTEITLPNGKVILAETMRKDFDLTRGMMFRDALAKDRGMLFVHPKEGVYAYWMYNCHVPLDIIWMSPQRRIVEIYENTPPCTSTSAKQCPTYGGHEKSQYVLELNGGGAAAYGLRVGDTISF